MISVVIPCYNESEVLELTYQSLTEAAKAWGDAIEILFVDDGSSDDTWQIIEALSQRDSRVRGVRLSRNFGQAAALGAGLERAAGEAVVVLDADLQDPPELVSEMLARWRQGYDVVYAQRSTRHGETWFKLATAGLFYRLLDKLNTISIPGNCSDFSLLDARVVRTMLGFREHAMFWRGLRSFSGFRQTAVHFDRPSRAAGATKYNFKRMLKLASYGLLGFSELPLRLPLVLGGSLLVGSLLLGCMSLLAQVGVLPAGWSVSISTIAIFFLASTQLISLGVMGEYLNRIYDEVRDRPRWIVADAVGESTPSAVCDSPRRKAG